MRRKLTELMQQRAIVLEAAEAALSAQDQQRFDSEMEKIGNMNREIDSVKQLIAQQDKQFLGKTPDLAEEQDKAEQRGADLKKGLAVQLSPREALRDLAKAQTLAQGQIVQPTGGGQVIRDALGARPSSIVDQVYVQDLTGMGSFLEPYVISQTEASARAVKTNAGKARPESTDPVFGMAKISPYEISVTNYVDRNISRLSPANYYAKVYSMAMGALRRKLAQLIVSGDGQASPDFYGIKTAKNTAGADIFATLEVDKIDETLLDSLFFAYGGDSETGGGARLYLNKADLAALGKLRNGDKQRVFKIRPEADNPNCGMIEDGGAMIPYTIVPSLTALSAGGQGQTMVYGDPMHYELGLFGDYTIRVDESIKGVERMYTILGDCMAGGNLIVDKGFVVATTLTHNDGADG